MRLGDLDALKEHAKNILVGESINTVLGINLYKIFEEIIDNAPTVDITQIYYNGFTDGKELSKKPQGEWIPVSERLPEERGMYLVTEKEFAIGDRNHSGKFKVKTEQVEFYDGKWNRAKFFEVIAWQPLPEPYKKGDKE